MSKSLGINKKSSGKISEKISGLEEKKDKRRNPRQTGISDSLLISTKSHITIITLDGQIKIKDDALYYLKTWSHRINMLPLQTDDMSDSSETISTFNVSASYLMRLICIAIASYECFQFSTDPSQEQFTERKIKQILSMFDAYNQDEFTSCYNEELDMIIDKNELTIVKFMKGIGFTKPIQFSNPLPRIILSTYRLLNAFDGEIKIPNQVKPIEYLETWFNKIKISTTLNVSKSYLMRLVCIALSFYQCEEFSTFLQYRDMVEEKKQQILCMFDAHNRDEMTSFYNEQMEINESELIKSMESIGFVKPIDGKWILPPNFLVGVDTMDSRFTLPQYTVIAILSYFNYLNNTHPEKVKGLNIEVSLLENLRQYSLVEEESTHRQYLLKESTIQNPIQYPLEETTWFPESIIKIGNIFIELYTKPDTYKIKYHNINSIKYSLKYNSLHNPMRKRTDQEDMFSKDIVTLLDKCWVNPINRNWSMLKDDLKMLKDDLM